MPSSKHGRWGAGRGDTRPSIAYEPHGHALRPALARGLSPGGLAERSQEEAGVTATLREPSTLPL